MIVVTGATGFVGQALLSALQSEGFDVTTLGRRKSGSLPFIEADLNKLHHVEPALSQAETVIHCAARVHIMNDDAADPLAEFRQTNTQGTLELASQAAAAGVQHFIFLSTIKVLGEETEPGTPYNADSPAQPRDPYGQSKYEAEQGLWKLSEATGMSVTVIRPPLVYGPGVGANFLKLYGWVEKGLPLPFGSLNNKRSMVAVQNLVSLIVTCVGNPSACGKHFLVSDDDDVSTAELVRYMSRSMDKEAKLIAVPPVCLKTLGAITGKRDVIQRLCGSLQVDITETKLCLDWRPIVTLPEQLKQMSSRGGNNDQ
ncbi:UDP-glucose 4-epimerase family protein [Aliidiomarina sp. Khilg15.8]